MADIHKILNTDPYLEVAGMGTICNKLNLPVNYVNN